MAPRRARAQTGRTRSSRPFGPLLKYLWLWRERAGEHGVGGRVGGTGGGSTRWGGFLRRPPREGSKRRRGAPRWSNADAARPPLWLWNGTTGQRGEVNRLSGGGAHPLSPNPMVRQMHAVADSRRGVHQLACVEGGEIRAGGFGRAEAPVLRGAEGVGTDSQPREVSRWGGIARLRWGAHHSVRLTTGAKCMNFRVVC